MSFHVLLTWVWHQISFFHTPVSLQLKINFRFLKLLNAKFDCEQIPDLEEYVWDSPIGTYGPHGAGALRVNSVVKLVAVHWNKFSCKHSERHTFLLALG